jgi:hypothetical protein
VVGVAFPDERDFDEGALKRFEEAAATLPEIDARP